MAEIKEIKKEKIALRKMLEQMQADLNYIKEKLDDMMDPFKK